MKSSIVTQLQLLNQTILESLKASNEKIIVKNFVNLSVRMLKGDYGFAWYTNSGKEDFHWVYKTKSTPYTPTLPRKNGVMAHALRSKKTVFIENIAKHKFARKEAKENMKSVAVVPMIYKGKVYGNLIIAYKKKHHFTPEEQILCSLFSNSAAQAITINRLYTDLQDFKYTLDNTRDGMLMLDPEKLQILYANKTATRHLGISEKKLMGKPVTDLSTGVILEDFRDIIDAVVNNPSERRLFETEVTLQGKTTLPVEVSLEHVVRQGSPKQPRLLATVRNISKEKEAETAVKRSIYYDKLTGLPNRTYLMEELPKILDTIKAEGRQCGLILIDVDKFKFINDMLGHGAGDTLLTDIANRIWNTVEKHATVARTGGNEFTMVLDQIKSVQDIEHIAEQIQDAFTEPFMVDMQEIFISVSLGISIFPGDGDDVQVLLRNAHASLRWVKESGGGAFRLYYADIAALSPTQLKLEQQLRQAVKKGQLVIHYQPQINVLTGKVAGAEALLRWNHPELGLLLPEEFLSRTEDSAFIVDIGYWMLHESARQIKDWEALGVGTIPVSLRLSQRQLTQGNNVVGDVGRILAIAGVSPDLISFEVSESMAIKHSDIAMQVFTNFKLLGIKFVIGDFGRGYTSLSNLKRLPVDSIKIDRSFIQDMGSNRHDRAIVGAMISMAHDMRMSVIADGVNEDRQLRLLSKQECDIVQGPYIGSELPAAEFSKWVMQLKATQKTIR